ncbi:hypothetical protein M422DRAFT_53912 [Sphaerobolus stellatus SS14]|uniref:Uncharacterized protein n=1 Tax=Sphaerobolus stellatus (strain SS14) TaxID=990650 RepID=A0A0C9UMP6_SPHS4|nr:hypothetical protein M422DRAFT_53912 [Sphaerobolus stellatus SS14]
MGTNILPKTGLITVPEDAEIDFPQTAKEIIHPYFSIKLWSRLHCDTAGHILCFQDRVSGVHWKVSGSEFSIWVDALCEGEAMLTYPPDALRFAPSSSALGDFSDRDTVVSTSSRGYASSLSSGVPGPGYCSGKGLKWLGAKALIPINTLVMWTQVSSEASKLLETWKSSNMETDSIDYMGLLKIIFDLTEYLRPRYPSFVRSSVGSNLKKLAIFLSSLSQDQLTGMGSDLLRIIEFYADLVKNIPQTHLFIEKALYGPESLNLRGCPLELLFIALVRRCLVFLNGQEHPSFKKHYILRLSSQISKNRFIAIPGSSVEEDEPTLQKIALSFSSQYTNTEREFIMPWLQEDYVYSTWPIQEHWQWCSKIISGAGSISLLIDQLSRPTELSNVELLQLTSDFRLRLGYLSCRNMDISLRTNTVRAMINIISIYTKIWKFENSLGFKLSAPYPEEQLVHEAFNVLVGMLPSIKYTLPGVGTDSLPTSIEDELYQLYQNILKNRYFEPDDSHLDMGLDLHRKMFKLLSQHGISCLDPDERLKGFGKEILEEVEEDLLLCGAGVRGSSLRARRFVGIVILKLFSCFEWKLAYRRCEPLNTLFIYSRSHMTPTDYYSA